MELFVIIYQRILIQSPNKTLSDSNQFIKRAFELCQSLINYLFYFVIGKGGNSIEISSGQKGVMSGHVKRFATLSLELLNFFATRMEFNKIFTMARDKILLDIIMPLITADAQEQRNFEEEP